MCSIANVMGRQPERESTFQLPAHHCVASMRRDRLAATAKAAYSTVVSVGIAGSPFIRLCAVIGSSAKAFAR